MFSGGLDSLAGALEETVARQESVALVSHSSATRIARVQRDLVTRMRERISPNKLMHSITRLIGAILFEQNDEWQTQNRYMVPSISSRE